MQIALSVYQLMISLINITANDNNLQLFLSDNT